MKAQKIQPIIIASHRRSGTHLTIDTFRSQFIECGSWKLPLEKLDRLYLNLDAMHPDFAGKTISVTTAKKILSRASRPLIKTHQLPPVQASPLRGKNDEMFECSLKHAQTIYVCRDGRDVACSYWLFRKVFDPESQINLSDFLRLEDEDGKNCILQWKEHVSAWREQPDVIFLKFEDLMNEPRSTLLKLAEILHLTPLKQDPHLPRPWKNVLESRFRGRLLGIKPRATTILGRNRFSQKVSWRKAFSAQDHAFFKEQAGDLLNELGYE